MQLSKPRQEKLLSDLDETQQHQIAVNKAITGAQELEKAIERLGEALNKDDGSLVLGEERALEVPIAHLQKVFNLPIALEYQSTWTRAEADVLEQRRSKVTPALVDGKYPRGEE